MRILVLSLALLVGACSQQSSFERACSDDLKTYLKSPSSFQLIEFTRSMEVKETEFDPTKKARMETLRDLESKTQAQATEFANLVLEYSKTPSGQNYVYTGVMEYDAKNPMGTMMRGSATCTAITKGMFRKSDSHRVTVSF